MQEASYEISTAVDFGDLCSDMQDVLSKQSFLMSGASTPPTPKGSPTTILTLRIATDETWKDSDAEKQFLAALSELKYQLVPVSHARS